MSSALDTSLKVLFVQSLAADSDQQAVDQLRAAAPELQITTIAGSAAALAELRRKPGWQALFASPSMPQNEVLALITSLRRDGIPIAIVPILDDAHQDLFASAVASGADDVLVRRAEGLVNVGETLIRIRQSPHLFPAEQRRRIWVLYAGRDPLVWNLLEQVPFAQADRASVGADGTCTVRRPGSEDDETRVDAVIIDEAPGDAHPLQVLKSVKAQAPDLPVIMLTSAGSADIATAALELGADDTVLKAGIFRRRLVATLRRVHQRLEVSAQQLETRTRAERLRQIVENVPTGIMVVGGDGHVLAMNAAALRLFGASRSRDVVGRDFRDLISESDRDPFSDLMHSVTSGEGGGLTLSGLPLTGGTLELRLNAVMIERDTRGGKGIVASIARTEEPGGEADGTGAAFELATLRDSVQTLERHHAELEDARARERASWESDRQELTSRLEEAERLAAERRVLQERLDEVTAELARTSQSFVAERQTLERRLEDLEQAAREAQAAGAGRSDLEQELEAVREEQRQAIDAHALERSGWEEIRTELEGRVQQLDARDQSNTDSTVDSLRADIQRLEQTLVDERTRWATTRGQLETELRNAREALWAEHTERDASRATFEAEVEALRATLDAERARWHGLRIELEQQVADSRGLAASAEADRDRLVAELEGKNLDLQTTFDAERAEWQQARRALEQDLANACAAADVQDSERENARLELEQRVMELDNALGQARNDRAAVQQTLEDSRRQLEERLNREQAEWADERSALDSERQRALDRASRVADLEAERDHLSVALDDAQRRAGEAEESARTLANELEAALAAATTDAHRHAEQMEVERTHLEQVAIDGRTAADRERGHLVSLHAREAQEWRQAVDRARTERDQATERLAGVEADLQQAQNQLAELDHLRETLAAALSDFEAARRRAAELEARLAADEAATADYEQLREALAAAHNEIKQTDAAHHTDRELWTTRHSELEARLADVEATLERERGDRQTERAGMMADHDEAGRLLRAQQVLAGTIASLQAEHAALSTALSEARAERDQMSQTLEATRAELAEAIARSSGDAAHADGFVQDADARLLASEVFGYALTSMTGELIDCNDTFARMLGFANAADVRSSHAGRPFPGWADRPDMAATLAATGYIGRVVSCLEGADRRPVRAIESATLLTNRADAGRSVVEHILVADPGRATSAQRLQRRLRDVGSLAAAMMPELQSLSLSLRTRSEAVATRTRAGQLATDDASVLQTTSDRVAALIAQLAGFTRRQTQPSELIDLGQVVRDAEELLTALVGSYVHFSTELAPADAVDAQRSDLDQLVTSLVTIGRDLLPTGGALALRVAHEEGTEMTGPVLAVTASGYGVQAPSSLTSLELMADRCGGVVKTTGDEGHTVGVAVHFPRCGRPGDAPSAQSPDRY